jgi:Tol biopolymer transport system component
MDSDGNDVERLTSPCVGQPVSPVWSPDGNLIAFGCRIPDGSRNLCVVGTEGDKGWRPDCKEYAALIDSKEVPSEFCDEYTVNSVSWAPDGQRLAVTCPYQEQQTTETLVCVITLDGEVNYCWPVSDIDGENGRPHQASVDWSPIQDRLVVSIDNRIYLVDPDGQNSAFLVDGRDPSWSPNGKQIAFFHNTDGLYVIDQDGSDLHCIYRYPTYPGGDSDEILPGFTSRPVWSPNGRFVVFSGSRNPSGGLTGIYVVNLKTKEIERITELYDGHFSDPDWSP